MTKPIYLSPSPRPVTSIDIKRITDSNTGWDYQFVLGDAGYLHLTAADANDLFHVLAKRLYDDNTLSMDTAEHVGYLCHVVVQDPREALEAAQMEAGE